MICWMLTGRPDVHPRNMSNHLTLTSNNNHMVILIQVHLHYSYCCYYTMYIRISIPILDGENHHDGHDSPL